MTQVLKSRIEKGNWKVEKTNLSCSKRGKWFRELEVLKKTSMLRLRVERQARIGFTFYDGDSVLKIKPPFFVRQDRFQ